MHLRHLGTRDTWELERHLGTKTLEGYLSRLSTFDLRHSKHLRALDLIDSVDH